MSTTTNSSIPPPGGEPPVEPTVSRPLLDEAALDALMAKVDADGLESKTCN